MSSCEKAFGGYLIRWQANTAFLWQAVLARVKQLPARLRHYDQESKTWWIDDRALLWLREVFSNFDDATAIAQRRPVRNTPPPQVVRAFTSLHMQPSAPPVAVRAVYRVLKKWGDVTPDVTAERVMAWDRAYLVALTWAEEHTSAQAA
ncbi:MAG: hypothetical protein ACREJM_01965 [Candidatus Saccharimonadales bacterium]